MVTYVPGVPISSGITASTTTAYGQAPDRFQVYDFADRILTLGVTEAPFFEFVASVNTVGAPSAQFLYLEDRTISNLYSRDFFLSAGVNGGSDVVDNATYTFKIDNGSGASIDWVVKGDTFVVNTVYSNAGTSYVLVRIEDGPVDMGVFTQFTGRIIDTTATAVSGTVVLADNDRCIHNTSAHAENTGAPDVVRSVREDAFGLMQIVKTAWGLSGSASATEYRGTKDEWERMAFEAGVEHKLKLEKNYLFGIRGLRNGIRYTAGLVSDILVNSTVVADNTDFSYTSGASYLRSLAKSEFTYDRILSDMEVINHPGRGGNRRSEKIGFASAPIISFVNKIAAGAGFLPNSTLSGGTTSVYVNWDLDPGQTEFGHELMTINTVHGKVHLTEEPLFQGAARMHLLFADMTHLAHRPLVGNGISRDTFMQDNIQNNDTDGRKAQLLTESGLEIGLKESHALYLLEGL